MVGRDYTKALADVSAELDEVLQQDRDLAAKREALAPTIIRLRNAKLALSDLCAKSPVPPKFEAPFSFPSLGLRAMAGEWSIDPDIGLTFATRNVFAANTSVWLDAAKVKEFLDALKFDWSSYTQPLSALHTVLKRLSVRELETKTEDGKLFYKKREVPLPRRKRKLPRAHLRAPVPMSVEDGAAERS